MHVEVSRVVEKASQTRLFDHLNVWDTNGQLGKPPMLIISQGQNEAPVIHEEVKMRAFLAKGHEGETYA